MWTIDPNGLKQGRIGYLQFSLNFSLFEVQKYKNKEKKRQKQKKYYNNNNNKQQASKEDDDTAAKLIQFVSFFLPIEPLE